MSCAATVSTRAPITPRAHRRTLQDARGVPVSVSDPQTLELFETALRQYQSYVGDAVATLDEALGRDPDFILAHVMRATVLATFTERRFVEQARVNVASAEALLPHANERERLLVTAA